MVIDAHAHLAGPEECYEYFRGFANVCGPAGRGLRKFAVSDERLEECIQPQIKQFLQLGTEMQLVTPPDHAIPTAERRGILVMGITQQLNDMTAQCVRLHPENIAGLASLPQSPSIQPRTALEEIDRCVRELGLIGVRINPDPGEGGWEAPEMGNEYWYPIYEHAQALDLPLFIHGGSSRFSRESQAGYSCQEVTVAGWSLLRSPHVWRDFPALRVVLAHGGGYIPYQFGRARCFRVNEQGRGNDELWEPFETSLHRLFFDTALFDRASIELLIKICGVEQCLFGSEMHGVSITDGHTGRLVHDLRPLINEITWLDESDREALLEENARRVYTRLQ